MENNTHLLLSSSGSGVRAQLTGVSAQGVPGLGSWSQIVSSSGSSAGKEFAAMLTHVGDRISFLVVLGLRTPLTNFGQSCPSAPRSHPQLLTIRTSNMSAYYFKAGKESFQNKSTNKTVYHNQISDILSPLPHQNG